MHMAPGLYWKTVFCTDLYTTLYKYAKKKKKKAATTLVVYKLYIY